MSGKSSLISIPVLNESSTQYYRNVVIAAFRRTCPTIAFVFWHICKLLGQLIKDSKKTRSPFGFPSGTTCFLFAGKTRWIAKCLTKTQMKSKEKGWHVQKCLSSCGAMCGRLSPLSVHEELSLFHLCCPSFSPGKIPLTQNHHLWKSPVWILKKKNTGVQSRVLPYVKHNPHVCIAAFFTFFPQNNYCVSVTTLFLRCFRKDSTDSKPSQPVKRHSTDSKPER